VRRSKTVWFAAVVVLWLLGLGTALAQDLIVLSPQVHEVSLEGRSHYWIDPKSERTPDQLEVAGDSLPWAVREPGATHRIDGKALWIYFEALNTAEKPWFLCLKSSGIDRVQLFYRSPEGRWVEQEAGDTKAVSDWPMRGRFPTFELSPLIGKPVPYWLRIEHERVDFATPIVIQDRSTLLASRELEQFLLGAYFGLAGLIVIVAGANAIAYRDRNFGAYAVYVGLLAAGQVAYLGIGAQHVWDHWLKWNEVAAFLLPGVSSAAALWFTRTVTEPARFSKALDLLVCSLIAALLSAVALATFIESRGSFALVMVLTALAVVVVIGLIILVWTQGDDPHIRLIALGFLPVLVMAIFPIAKGMNLIPISPLTRYGLSIGAALEMPILFYALSLRGSRRREAQVRAAALAHNDALTGLAHTRTLLQRLDSALVRCRALKHAGALMAVKISNFESIATEFGRETADKALVVAASLLRRAITDIDLAARVGEYEFALLLEGPTNKENAISRAQQVIASGLRSSDALPPGTTLKFHIAVALLPDKDLDSRGTMKWLIEGVNAIRSDARKLIRPLNF
jgi:diguanylate cyclase (GGDEF)-like protein